MSPSRLDRSRFVTTGAATLGFAAVLPGKARGAEFVYKLAHPNPVSFAQHVRSVQMANAVKAETNGRLEIQIYPNATLGSASAMVSQVRLGSVQFTEIGDSSWEGINPVAAITNVGFAFASSEQGLSSMDGALGAYIRKEFQSKGLYAFERTFDYSIRHITSSTKPIRNASDLAGFRLRAQPSAMVVDLWKTLGAAPTPLDATQLYTALQTHLLDGQEGSYQTVEGYRFYEVQKYLALSHSSWSGSWLVMNLEAWNALPPDIQTVLSRNAAKAALDERRDIRTQEPALADLLKRQGMQFNPTDDESMRARLAPFYARWKNEFGSSVWSLLEATSGKLG